MGVAGAQNEPGRGTRRLDTVASLFKLGEPRPASLAVTLAAAAVAGPDERERWNIRA